MYKRKRTSGAGVMALYKPVSSSYKKRRTFVPGRDRVGGYYGRFSGRSGELKFHDVDLDDAIIVNTGQITPSVNLIAQGVSESERVGRKCTIRSIGWRYKVSLPERDAVADPSAGDNVRVMLYVDKQANGATAAVTDILESADFQSFNNLSNSGRFIILHDKTYDCNYNAMASDGAGVVSLVQMQWNYSFYKKCEIPIEWSDTTGVMTEIRSNNIGALLIASQGVAGFGSKIRLRFSDA